MKITKVIYYGISNKDNSKYISKCSLVIEGLLMVHDITILEGKKGRYIIMPTKAKYNGDEVKSKNNNSEDVLHPVNKEYFSYMAKVVLDGYKLYEEKGSKVYIP